MSVGNRADMNCRREADDDIYAALTEIVPAEWNVSLFLACISRLTISKDSRALLYRLFGIRQEVAGLLSQRKASFILLEPAYTFRSSSLV